MMQTLKPARTVETFSAGLKLAMVARGEGDAYVNSYVGFNDWDVCAGQILVEEAGGTVSLFDGRPVIYGPVQANRLGFIATNGPLHSELLTRVNRPVS
jgi:fructose-1,6-bisphosphatase/inositol monophosphatase family enzyme